MGGSKGGYFSGSHSPADLIRRTRVAEDQARTQAFDADVAGYLTSLLADFNARDTEGTQTVLQQVKADLELEASGTITTLFGGSVAKHTYVDGISDVDALLLIDDAALAERPPSELIGLVARKLRRRYGDTAVHAGTLAVTVRIGTTVLQLLPALRRGDGFAIASGRSDVWSSVNPQKFARALTKANQRANAKLVPCIKLIKAIVARLPEQRRMTGYHTESIAINVFRDYGGPFTPKAMLQHFFENVSQHVTRRIRDASGQSVYVDEYMGPDGSLQRRIVADALARVGRQMRNADGALSPDRWRQLFD